MTGEQWKKFFTVAHGPDGKIKIFVRTIAHDELHFIQVNERYSRNGHTITIEIPAEHFEFI